MTAPCKVVDDHQYSNLVFCFEKVFLGTLGWSEFICSLGCRDLSTLTFQVLGLQICATMPSRNSNLKAFISLSYAAHLYSSTNYLTVIFFLERTNPPSSFRDFLMGTLGSAIQNAI